MFRLFDYGMAFRPVPPRRGRTASTSTPSPTSSAADATHSKNPCMPLHLLSGDWLEAASVASRSHFPLGLWPQGHSPAPSFGHSTPPFARGASPTPSAAGGADGFQPLLLPANLTH